MTVGAMSGGLFIGIGHRHDAGHCGAFSVLAWLFPDPLAPPDCPGSPHARRCQGDTFRNPAANLLRIDRLFVDECNARARCDTSFTNLASASTRPVACTCGVFCLLTGTAKFAIDPGCCGHVPQPVKPKVSHCTRRLFKLLIERMDLRDMQRERYDVKLGRSRPHQATNEVVERHLNAGTDEWQARLQPLAQYELESYRQGGGTIYARPRFNVSRPAIFVRIDIDEHHQQTDGKGLLKWLASHEAFAGKLYFEPSPHGWSAYATLILPRYEMPDGTARTPKLGQVNALLDQWQRHLQQQTATAEFKSTVEIKGRFTIKGTKDDSSRFIHHRGSACRLPKCLGGDADIDRLAASEFPLSIVGMMQAPTQQPTIVPQDVELPAMPPAPKRRSRARGRHIEDSGDKHTNRCRATRRAIQSILGKAFIPATVKTDECVAIHELTNTLLEENGLTSGRRDKKRDEAIRAIIKWELRTHDPNAAGAGSDVFFTFECDVARSEDIIRSKLSSRRLFEIQEENRAKLQGAEITYHALALTLCTVAKNWATTGSVPITSLIGMLRYFSICTNGSHARALLTVLKSLGLVTCISRSYKPGRWCRKYQPAGAAIHLPFIQHLEHKLIDPKIARQQGQIYMNQAAGGANNTLFYSLPLSMMSVSLAPIEHDEDGLPVYGCWRDQNAALEAEYADRGLF
jgi:hypothetical protein